MALFRKQSVSGFPEENDIVETFTSPDDDRSLTVLIGRGNKIIGAILAEHYDLSIRWLSRFYVLMRQARYSYHYYDIASQPIRIGYELFAIFNSYNNKVYIINDVFQDNDDKKIEKIFKLKYVLDAENESIRNERLLSTFNRLCRSTQEEFFRKDFSEKDFYNKIIDEKINTPDNLALLDNFNTNTIITYSTIQRELVIFFLEGIFKKYSLY